MTSPAGTWNVTISTPIGKQHVTYRITETDGKLEGVATHGTELIPMADLAANGARLTWTQAVTKPMKLTVKLDVTLDGDTMTGTAKAGMFPASKLEGKREG